MLKMATVFIDGVEDIQQEGLLYKDFIVSYPGCFLKQQENGISIRVPETVLETGKKYTLVRPPVHGKAPNQPLPTTPARPPPPPLLTFRDFVTLLQLHVTVPKRSVLRKMAKALSVNELDYIQMDPTGSRAYELYAEYEMLPETFTCQVVAQALHVTVNCPCKGEDKPFLLSANYFDGRPAMVKILRIDMDSPVHNTKKVKEYEMERKVLAILDFSGEQPGLVRAEFLEVQVPAHGATEAQRGSSVVPTQEGRPAHRVYAILMPRYVTTVARSPKFINVAQLGKQFSKLFDTLNYIHGREIVHLDIKGDNIFVDGAGEWFLGDFGSCKKIGEEVVSTTEVFHHTKLAGKPAVVGYDYFMLLMALMIELLPDKHAFRDALCDTQDAGVVRASRQKVYEASAQAKVKYPPLQELIEKIESAAV